jgi:hypothetical protein
MFDRYLLRRINLNLPKWVICCATPKLFCNRGASGLSLVLALCREGGAMRFERKLSRVGLVVFWVCGVQAAVSFAGQVIFEVDPARSSLTASGTFNGAALGPQFTLVGGGGSLVTSYGGIITTDLGANANSLQITGANIAAQDIKSAIIHPPLLINTKSANYGFFQNYSNLPPGESFAEYFGAIRGFSFSLGSPVINAPASFDASLLTGSVVTGELDSLYATSEFVTPVDVAYPNPIFGILQIATGNAQLADIGGVETLTIPFRTDLTIEVSGIGIPGEPLPLDLQLSGDIVATAAAPPAFLTGALMMAVFFGWSVVRSRSSA